MTTNDVTTDGPAGVEPPSQTQLVLERLGAAWARRAQVKKAELQPIFVDGEDDFLEGLLPFKDSPYYLSASPETKSRVLSCGWLIYNAKTTQIESDIVNPICMEIICGDVPGLHQEGAQYAVSETMVDEVYHIHLVERASRLTRRHRDLDSLSIPQFNLVRHMRRRQEDFSEPWEKLTVAFATAATSEIFISDYLHLLSDSDHIQPFNRLTVAAHRQDEMVHGPLFRSLAELFSAGISPAQRDLFGRVLAEPVGWFADRELDVWLAVLLQIEFPHAEEMIRQCRGDRGELDLETLDYSGVVTLADELGMLDNAAVQDGFHAHGLIGGRAG